MYRVCGIVRFTSDISPQTTTSLLPLCTNSLQRKHLERFPLVTGTFDSVSFSSSGMKQCQCLDSHPTPPPSQFRQVAIGALSTVPHLYKIVFTMNWPLQFFQTCKKNRIRIYTYNLKVAKNTQHASHMR